jgi:serine protease AprX
MFESIKTRTGKHGKWILLALIAVVLATLISLTALGLGSDAKATTGSVSVIVMKADKTTAAEELVAKLGGKITSDLDIINAFGADVPQDAVATLAASDAVRGVTPDGRVESTSYYYTTPGTYAGSNYYLDTLGVRKAWTLKDASGRSLNGQGIGVAVVDSGLTQTSSRAFTRIIDREHFSWTSWTDNDLFGHGTHVAGIIAGNGAGSTNNQFAGIAPGVNLIGLKVCDDQGYARESDAVEALQWIYDNRTRYNIRVVNLSINCGQNIDYDESPLDAACEILWFNKIVVVVSAGNKGGVADTYNTADAPPANDPFVITVGATDENGTAIRTDDQEASWSARGNAADSSKKPEILAPGAHIVSTLAPGSKWSNLAAKCRVGTDYVVASGTSMAAPMVVGTVALLLQDEPNLTPDQVKYRLLNATTDQVGCKPYLNAYAVVTSNTTQSENTGHDVSDLLTTGYLPVDFNNSTNWDSVKWNSVKWNSVKWNSVKWNSIKWNSFMWNSVMWNSVMWNS